MTDEEAPPAATPAAHIAAVNVKLPPFWPADPQVWFAQVEAQFTTRGITQQRTKFDYIVASLSPEYATEVRDLILQPPAAAPYDTLKHQLIQRTAASEQRRLQQLFNAKELGDRKPTQLLRRMQQLLGDKAGAMDSSVLRELFLQRLPANVRMVLASTPDTANYENLAQLADKVVEVAAPSVSTVSATHLSDEFERLRAEVTSLRKVVESLPLTTSSKTDHPLGRPRGHSRSQSQGRSSSPRPATDSPICWYHRRYGDEARKCTPPCSFSGNDQASH